MIRYTASKLVAFVHKRHGTNGDPVSLLDYKKFTPFDRRILRISRLLFNISYFLGYMICRAVGHHQWIQYDQQAKNEYVLRHHKVKRIANVLDEELERIRPHLTEKQTQACLDVVADLRADSQEALTWNYFCGRCRKTAISLEND